MVMEVISCKKCGVDIFVSPPDKIHKEVSEKVMNWNDYVKISTKCRKCSNFNIIYWNAPKYIE